VALQEQFTTQSAAESARIAKFEAERVKREKKVGGCGTCVCACVDVHARGRSIVFKRETCALSQAKRGGGGAAKGKKK
jgi:hypothetical protein